MNVNLLLLLSLDITLQSLQSFDVNFLGDSGGAFLEGFVRSLTLGWVCIFGSYSLSPSFLFIFQPAYSYCEIMQLLSV